jgi:WD40 repeat protein
MNQAIIPCFTLAMILSAAAIGCTTPIGFPGHRPLHRASMDGANLSAIEVSPDGKKVATAEYTSHWFIGKADVSIEIWNTADASRHSIVTCPYPGELIQSLAWSPDSRLLAYAAIGPNGGGRIVILNTATGAAEHTFEDPNMDRAEIAFTSDGRCLSTLAVYIHHRIMFPSTTAEFQVRDVESGTRLETFQTKVLNGVASLSSNAETIFWLDGELGCLAIRSRGSGTTILETLGKPAKRTVAWSSFSPRGDFLTVLTLPKPFIHMDPMLPDRISVLSIPEGQVIYEREWIPGKSRSPSFVEQKPPLIASTGVGKVRVSRDLQTVVTTDSDGVLKFWSGEELLDKQPSESKD